MTTTEKPTLETLGLTCSISPLGVRPMSPDSNDDPMCAWIVTFTNKAGRSENFDYFTGYGCGPAWREQWLRDRYPSVANVNPRMRYSIKDKNLLCRISHAHNLAVKWKPDPIEILWAIARDGDALEMSFEDWAHELGYDADSREAEKAYRACQENAFKLRKILTVGQIREIAQLDI